MLDLADVELTTEPIMAWFRFRAFDAHDGVRTVMKRYSDVLEFFDALQPLTHFATLPRNVDEVSLVHDHALRKQLQSQLDGLLGRLDIIKSHLFLDFFQLSEDYQHSSPSVASSQSLSPAGQAALQSSRYYTRVQDRERTPSASSSAQLSPHLNLGGVVPSTWPRDGSSQGEGLPAKGASIPTAQRLTAHRTLASGKSTAAIATTGAGLAPLVWDSVPNRGAVGQDSRSVVQERSRGSQEYLLKSPATPAVTSPWATTPSSREGSGTDQQTPSDGGHQQGVVQPMSARELRLDSPSLQSPPPAGRIPSVGTPTAKASDAVVVTSMGSSRSGRSGTSGGGRTGARPWCVVCMAKPEEVAVDPCGHLSMCQDCGNKVNACPVCRGPIEKLLRVYVVR